MRVGSGCTSRKSTPSSTCDLGSYNPRLQSSFIFFFDALNVLHRGEVMRSYEWIVYF